MTGSPVDPDDLREQDGHHIHPWRDFSVAEPPEVVARAEGPYIHTADGRRLLDGNGGGLSAVTLGYGNAEIADTAAEQIRTLQFYSHFGQFTAPPAARLSADLARVAPSHLNHVHFGTGGSIANETAIRFIHYYMNQTGRPGKKGIIAFAGAYHGSTLLTASLTGIDFFKLGFDVLGENIHRIPAPNTYRRPAGTTPEEFADSQIDLLRAAIETVGPERIAAMIAEPIMAVGGAITPPPGYYRRAQETCAAYDILFVADEVVTGFGRLGEFFTSEAVFGARPDVITCAKGLTSGYIPLSATLFSDEMWEVLSVPQAPGGMLTHGFTYSGHPVACAVGAKVVEIIERDDILGHVRAVGPYLHDQLMTLAELPIVGDVRGSHFYHGVELVVDKETKEPFPPELAIGKRVAHHARERGVMIRPMGHIAILSPPLIIDRSQVDFLVDALRGAITATADELAAARSTG